ncbi:MAG: ATP-grasp domain-containing protein [Clostridia bacterium]|nr:ATP-grasp domain-containing protein [Clostridia bacterium]
MNLLILAVGTRNKIIQYFKKALGEDGLIVAADASPFAPALYEADKHYIVPRTFDADFLETVVDICKREKINGIMSLIDPELTLLSKNYELFKKNGVTVLGSPYEACAVSLDKMRMFHWLSEHGYNTARSWLDKDIFFRDVDSNLASYPVVVKPHCGSASQNIFTATDKESVDFVFNHYDDMMIQEYFDGQEIGVDVYIDMISGDTVSIFAKKKLKMRAGETDKAVSFKDSALFELIERFVTEFGYSGAIDIDVFLKDGKYYIDEVNPRFGGGYPHAYESGCDYMTMIINNLRGISNKKCIGCYEEGIYMLKYSEMTIKGSL